VSSSALSSRETRSGKRRTVAARVEVHGQLRIGELWSLRGRERFRSSGQPVGCPSWPPPSCRSPRNYPQGKTRLASQILHGTEQQAELVAIGIGKPEPLKHGFHGYWSRRITDEHRLVYKISEDEIRISLGRGCRVAPALPGRRLGDAPLG